MREVLRASDPVLISVVETILQAEGVAVFIADRHISALEAGIGAFPLRVLVADDETPRVRRLLTAAGFGAELSTDKP